MPRERRPVRRTKDRRRPDVPAASRSREASAPAEELTAISDDVLPQSPPQEESPGRSGALTWPSPEVVEPGD